MSPSSATPEGARSILKNATELFARDGFDAVSMATIAAQAGVCKANIFHHFRSKEELFMVVMRAASAEHADWAEALIDKPGSSADKLRQIITFEIETLFGNEQRTRLILREMVDGGHERARLLVQQVFHRNFNAVIALFRQGQTRGEFRADIDPAIAALTMRGALTVFFQCRETLSLIPEAQHLGSLTAYASQISELLLAGISLPNTAASVAPATRRRTAATKPHKMKTATR